MKFYSESDAKKISDFIYAELAEWVTGIWYEIQDGGHFLLLVGELKEELTKLRIGELEKVSKKALFSRLPSSSGVEYPWILTFRHNEVVVCSILPELVLD